MEETYTENNKTSYTNVNNSKYYFDINDLLSFIFPKNLQHPLAAGRLFAFAMYGPLDNNNRIRSGIKGCRVVADYELDQMCQQFDKEDVICIYLHKRSDFGNLTSHEQSAIVSQADGHLKKEKGKAMLPAITKQDVIDILEDIPRNENGLLSFHDAQKVIMDYRDERIKQLKLVYPQLKQTKKADVSNTQTINENNLTITKKPKKRITRVDESIAPQTMFLHMKGMTNPDVIDQVVIFLEVMLYSGIY